MIQFCKSGSITATPGALMTKPTPCIFGDSFRLADTQARLAGAGQRGHAPHEKDGVITVAVRVRYGHNSMPNGVRWHVPTPPPNDDLTGQIVDFYA